jgi:sulfate transport system substrate-binding protein
MKTRWLNVIALLAVALAAALVVSANRAEDRTNQLLNVSYDPTGDLFKQLDRQFIDRYQHDTGKRLTIKESHGASSQQARQVSEGMQADVVTLAVYSDVDELRKAGLISDGWSKRLPNDSQPFHSTVVFVVRKGNPKGIADWPDLVKPGISVITPNPKTSGSGKLSVLAAWGSVIYRGGNDQQARRYLRQLYQHVPLLVTGARESTVAFADERAGDVQLTWESDALSEVKKSNGELQVVYPPVSILAEPTVAWVDKNVAGTEREAFAKAYLQFLYTETAQETIARNGYRPVDPEVARRYADRLPKMDLFPVTLLAGNWDEIQQRFFFTNGVFDQIYRPTAKL